MSGAAMAVRLAVDNLLAEANTALPGRVVSYDPASSPPRAVVQPDMAKLLADGTELPAPTIASVPVVWPGNTMGAGLSMPLPAGSGVLLVFAQRSLENWLSGSSAAPDDPRRFDLSDAIAIPGLGRSAPGVSGEDLELYFGPARLRLTPAGSLLLLTGGGTVTITPEGRAEFSGEIACPDIVVNGIRFSTHRHSETGSITQGPQT